MKTITLLGALTAIALSVNVQANQDVSGFYLGAGVGSTDANFSNDDISHTLPTDGTTAKIIAGYQFNRIVAIEAQYTTYGKIKLTPQDSWETETFSLAANLGYTFDNGLRPFATIGLSSLDLNQKISDPDLLLDDSNSTALRFGAGLEYTPAALSGVSFRAGYEADAFIIKENLVSDTNVLIGSVYVAASYKF